MMRNVPMPVMTVTNTLSSDSLVLTNTLIPKYVQNVLMLSPSLRFNHLLPLGNTDESWSYFYGFFNFNV